MHNDQEHEPEQQNTTTQGDLRAKPVGDLREKNEKTEHLTTNIEDLVVKTAVTAVDQTAVYVKTWTQSLRKSTASRTLFSTSMVGIAMTGEKTTDRDRGLQQPTGTPAQCHRGQVHQMSDTDRSQMTDGRIQLEMVIQMIY